MLASNTGKVFERINNERVKREVQLTDAQAGGIPGSATCNHLIILDQTIEEIGNDKNTTYIIFLDVQKPYNKTWLDGILHTLHRNGVKDENLSMTKELNSNLRSRIHTRHGLTREITIKRQHKTRRSPIGKIIRNPNRLNSQRTKKII